MVFGDRLDVQSYTEIRLPLAADYVGKGSYFYLGGNLGRSERVVFQHQKGEVFYSGISLYFIIYRKVVPEILALQSLKAFSF